MPFRTLSTRCCHMLVVFQKGDFRMKLYPDPKMLAGMANGSQREFTRFYLANQQMVLRKIIYYMKQYSEDAMDVYDILMNKFFYYYQDNHETIHNLNAYYSIMVKHAVFNYVDRQKHQMSDVVCMDNDVLLEFLGEQENDSLSMEEQAELRMVIEELEMFSETLPEHQRNCFKLYYLQLMTYQEIADALNMNINTVKSTLHYARRKMKKYYEENFGGRCYG